MTSERWVSSTDMLSAKVYCSRFRSSENISGTDQARIGRIDLGRAGEKDPAQHHACHPVGMRGRIGERQRAAPRTAEEHHAVETQMASYRLDIGDQVSGRVVRRRAVRRRLPAPALVEQHDAIELRIEKAAMDRSRAAARAAMKKHRRKPPRISARLDVDRVAAADGHLLHCKRLQLGVQRLVVHGVFIRGGIGSMPMLSVGPA